MIRVISLVGARTDPVLHERLHQLEHHNADEIVMVAIGDLDRRRLLMRTRASEEIAIALPREESSSTAQFWSSGTIERSC